MAKFRVEYLRLRRTGDNGLPIPEVTPLPVAPAFTMQVGPVSARSAAAPDFDVVDGTGVYARIISLVGAAVIEIAENPIADVAGGVMLSAGRELLLPITAGQHIAAIEVDDYVTATGNVTNRFREAFETYDPANGDRWNEVAKAAGDIVMLDGNAAAASYLVISKDPLTPGTETIIETRAVFDMPMELSIGVHTSQRTLGQEFAIEVVSIEDPLPEFQDLVVASISQAASVLTVTTSTPHGLVPGKRIGIYGVPDSRLNYPALVVATINPVTNTFTATAGPGGAIPSLTITAQASGFVYGRSSLGGARDGTSMIFENSASTNAAFYARSDSGDATASGTMAGSHASTISNSASTAAITAAYTFAWNPSSEYRLVQAADSLQWSDVGIDATGETTNRFKRVQVVPNPSKKYKLRIRAVNNKGWTAPVGQVVSITKTGTTTATVTTDRPHGLTTADVVALHGVRDQTAFPNTAGTVTGTPSATTFTIVVGSAATATSYGGLINRVQGGNASVGLVSQVGASATLTGGVLTLTLNTTASGVSIGDYVNAVGVRNAANGASLGVDGAWRIRAISGAVLELEAIGATTPPADFASTNCGGAVVRRTDLRISFVRMLDFERLRVEPTPRPNGDASLAFPMKLTTAVNQGARNASGAGWNVQPDNYLVTDVASAAITATTTTAAIVPNVAGGAAQFNISVTALTGAGAFMDLGVEESDDSGTNWVRIWDFARITAIGAYRTPLLPLTGNRLRYVQTIGGTSPNMTRQINRVVQPMISGVPSRRVINRSLLVNAVGSRAEIVTGAARNISAEISMAAGGTAAPQVQLFGSDDNWATEVPISNPATAAASVITTLSASGVDFDKIAVKVVQAGTGAVLNSVTLKAAGV